LRQRGYFRPAEINRLIDEHVSGRRNHDLRLWQLFVFELWHRQYVDIAGRATPGVNRIAVQTA
jgi:asparagine synthase (glutamine-hydrolysing)